MWTDGRYFQQAAAEMGPDWVLMREREKDVPKLDEWLGREWERERAQGQAKTKTPRIGVDPSLMAAASFRALLKALAKRGLALVAAEGENLVDMVWAEQRPPRPQSSLVALPQSISGQSYVEKVNYLRSLMATRGAVALVLSALDEVAWLLNLRGADIPYNPVFFAFLLLTEKEIRLFIDSEEREGFVSLAKEAIPEVRILPYSGILAVLKSEVEKDGEGRFWLPGEATSAALAVLLSEERWISDPSPVAMAKALKNPVEAAGMAEAHRKDAVAHVEFNWWLEGEMTAGRAQDELSAAAKFEELRRAQKDFVSLSFPTISAAGASASSPHYLPSPATNRPILPTDLYLTDSGAQFRQGTTDVTRMLAWGPQPDHIKEAYTLVLQGHIRLASQKFPAGTPGVQLDSVARLPLWQAGLDFGHGVGHGVGHFLNVHEGPMGIGNRDPVSSKEALKANMILTIEPGYYKDGEFGIRIENVYQLVPVKTRLSHPGREFLGFRSLTLVPIQTDLIRPGILEADEIGWLNDYHSRVLAELSPMLKLQGKLQVLAWLEKACQPYKE